MIGSNRNPFHPRALRRWLVRGSWRSLYFILFVIIGTVTAAWPLRQDSSAALARAIYEQSLCSVGWVLAADQGKGTGWVVDAQRRLLITNHHVVANGFVEIQFPVLRDGRPITERTWYLQNRRELLKTGRLVQGRVLRSEPAIDLALLQLDSLPDDVRALALAHASLGPGDAVFGLGNRYDSVALWACSHGQVRQVRTLGEGYFSGGQQLAKGARSLHVQMPINEGDSGGPLLNERGEAVGVAAAVDWEHQGAGLFIDLVEINALLSRAGCLPLPGPSRPSTDSPARRVYRQVVHSLVLVQAHSSANRHTGWLLDRSRRLIVTTADAVGTAETVHVAFLEFDAGQVIAEARHYRDKKAQVVAVVLARDSRRNVALVEAAWLPEKAEPGQLAKEDCFPGDRLHVLSNPDKFDTLWLYSGGWLRQKGRVQLGPTATEPEPEVLLMQSTSVEGEDGAPVCNDQIEVVGMLTGKSAPQQQTAYALAVSEIQAFLREQRARWDPVSAGDLIARGQLFLKARQSDRALVDFSAALRTDPVNALACCERSRAFQEKGNLDRALQDSNRAIRVQPQWANGYTQRAAVQLQRGQPRLAMADCDLALAIDRNDAMAFRVRGTALSEVGELDRALADLTDAIWLDRKSALAYLYRGRVYTRKNDWDRAIADFNQALAHDPLLAQGYRSRADVFWARSDVQAAWTDYDQALTLDAADAEACLGRGRAWSARHDAARALIDFNRCIQLAPRFSTGYLERGREHLRARNNDLALADFKVVMDLKPTMARDVVASIQRRARELEQGTDVDRQVCCRLCRAALQLLEPYGRERPKLRQLLQEGRKDLPEDMESGLHARRMLILVEAIREMLAAEQSNRDDG